MTGKQWLIVRDQAALSTKESVIDALAEAMDIIDEATGQNASNRVLKKLSNVLTIEDFWNAEEIKALET